MSSIWLPLPWDGKITVCVTFLDLPTHLVFSIQAYYPTIQKILVTIPSIFTNIIEILKMTKYLSITMTSNLKMIESSEI